MCGRYALAATSDQTWADVSERLGPAVAAALGAQPPRYNVCPSTDVPVVFQEDGRTEVIAALARWGFVPQWWKEDRPPRFATINARQEEAALKPLWRGAWRQQRCLIPATHWYEWQDGPGGKTPYAHAPENGRGFMFAGLWSRWRVPGQAAPRLTCAIVTRAAAPTLAHIHIRMPAILQPDAWRDWLDPELRDPAAVEGLLRTHAVEEARTWVVSRAVNRPGTEGADLLQPILSP